MAAGLFDQDRPGDLGLPIVEARHTLLHRADEGGDRYAHHPQLVVYRERLLVMWSSGAADENSNGQRIVGRESRDGIEWSDARVLAEDPDGSGPRVVLAAGFHVHDSTLVRYEVESARAQPRHPETALFARASSDSRTRGERRRIAGGFFLGGPRALPGGRLLLEGTRASGQPLLLYSDDRGGLGGWREARLAEVEAFEGAYPEPDWFLRGEGEIVMLFRTRLDIPWLYASTSTDGGETWSRPRRTPFPDATARLAAGNLPDGRAFVVSNPSQRFGRTPLAIALSQDGALFDAAYAIRGGATRPRFPGRSKRPGWQYPAALAWRDQLFVAYSINKEDVGISRIALSDLAGARLSARGLGAAGAPREAATPR